MPLVDYDEFGFFDSYTGDPVELAYAENGQFYNSLTGEEVDLIGQGIRAAQNTLIGIFGRQGYPNPRGGGGYSQGPPRDPNYGQDPRGASPGRVNTQGFQLNWWSAALIGVVAGAFFLGKKGR